MKDYKEKYLKLKEKLEDIENRNQTPKEEVIKKVANIFKEEFKEEKSWTNEKTGEINKYIALTPFYEKLNILSREWLSDFLLKINKLKKEVGK